MTSNEQVGGSEISTDAHSKRSSAGQGPTTQRMARTHRHPGWVLFFAILLQIQTLVNGQNIFREIGSNDPAKCDIIGTTFGNYKVGTAAGLADKWHLLVGAQTYSPSFLRQTTNEIKPCLSNPVPFIQRFEATSAGLVLGIPQSLGIRFYTDVILYQDQSHNFGKVLSTHFSHSETITGTGFTTVAPTNYAVAIQVLKQTDQTYQGCYLFFHAMDNSIFKMVFIPGSTQLPPFQASSKLYKKNNVLSFGYGIDYRVNYDSRPMILSYQEIDVAASRANLFYSVLTSDNSKGVTKFGVTTLNVNGAGLGYCGHAHFSNSIQFPYQVMCHFVSFEENTQNQRAHAMTVEATNSSAPFYSVDFLKFNYFRYMKTIDADKDMIYYGVATAKDANLVPMPITNLKNFVALFTFAPFFLESGCIGNEVTMMDFSEPGVEIFLRILTVQDADITDPLMARMRVVAVYSKELTELDKTGGLNNHIHAIEIPTTLRCLSSSQMEVTDLSMDSQFTMDGTKLSHPFTKGDQQSGKFDKNPFYKSSFGAACTSLDYSNPCTVVGVSQQTFFKNDIIYMVNTNQKFKQGKGNLLQDGNMEYPTSGVSTLTNSERQSIMLVLAQPLDELSVQFEKNDVLWSVGMFFANQKITGGGFLLPKAQSNYMSSVEDFECSCTLDTSPMASLSGLQLIQAKLFSPKVSGLQDINNDLTVPFDIRSWITIPGTGKCVMCAKAFDFKMIDANATSVSSPPEGKVIDKNLVFKFDLSGSNTQITVNNYVSKFRMTVKPMFTTTAITMAGSICVNFMNVWRMPEMDTCMGLTSPQTLKKKTDTMFTTGRIFGETTSVYFYKDPQTQIVIWNNPLTFANLKCHPENDEVRIYNQNLEIQYDPVLSPITMNQPQSYFVTNDFWSDGTQMISMIVLAQDYSILKSGSAISFVNNKIYFTFTVAETLTLSQSTNLWVLVFHQACAFVNDTAMLTPSEFVQNGPSFENLDIRPRYMKLNLNITRCNAKNVGPTVQWLNLTIQKNQYQDSENQYRVMLKTAAQVNELFIATDATCQIKGWYLSKFNTTDLEPLNKTLDISNRMQQWTRNLSNPNLDDLVLDTENKMRQEIQFFFQLVAKDIQITNNGVQTIAYKRMAINFNIRIGCFIPSLYVRLRPKTFANVVSFVDNILMLVFPMRLETTAFSFNLNEQVEYYSKYDLCGAYKMTAFNDALHTPIGNDTSALTRLRKNPTIVELETGDFSPIIEGTYGGSQSIPWSLYLLVETERSPGGVIESLNMTLLFEICENQPVATYDKVYQVQVDQYVEKSVDISQFFQSNVVRYPLCDGHDFIPSTSGSEIKPFVFDSVSNLDDNLKINARNIGSFEFYLIIKSRQSLKQTSMRIRINVNAFCLRENIVPVDPQFLFYVQKNTLINGVSVVEFSTSDQVLGLFTAPRNDSCKISEWYPSQESDVEMVPSEKALSQRLKFYPHQLFNNLKIDTFYDGFDDPSFTFLVRVYSGEGQLKVLVKSVARVTVTLTCIDPSIFKINKIPDSDFLNIAQISDQEVVFVFPRLRQKVTETLDIGKVLQFQPHRKHCGVERITQYKDGSYQGLSSKIGARLVENPSFPYQKSPVVELQYGGSQEPPPRMFLKLGSKNVEDEDLAQPLVISFLICNDKPLAVKQDTFIEIVHERDNVFKRDLNLLEIFNINFEYPNVCKAYEYTLTSGQDRATLKQYDEVQIEGDTLKLDFLVKQSLTFYVQVYYPLTMMRAYQKIIIRANSRPVFTQNLLPIKIKITEGLKIPKTEQFFKYKSPKAIDFDKQPIKMTFSTLGDLDPITKITHKTDDNTFELQIDLFEVTPEMEKEYILEVELTDPDQMSTTWTLPIQIEFLLIDEFEPVEPEQEGGVESLEPSGEMPENPVTGIVTYFEPPDDEQATFKLPPRIKQPVARVEYSIPDLKFKREEPTITSIKVDKRSNLKLEFSDNMVWPEMWTQKMEADAEGRRLPEMQFIEIGLKAAETEEVQMFTLDQLKLVRMEGKQMVIKILFENPELISMGTMIGNDQLIVKIPKDLVLYNENGRSLVLDKGQVTNDRAIQLEVLIQPQLHETNTILIEILRYLVPATSGFLIFQVLSNEFFKFDVLPTWTLVHSQQLFSLLPIFSLQLPSHANLFLLHLFKFSSFEPYMEFGQENIFDFKWTGATTSQNTNLLLIDIKSTSFIRNIGGRFFMLVICSIYMSMSVCCYYVNRSMFLKYGMTIDRFRRWIFTFSYVFYTELLIYALATFENEELIGLPSNWMIGGNLNASDQFSLVMGVAFLFILMVLPPVILSVALKQREAIYQNGWYRLKLTKCWGTFMINIKEGYNQALQYNFLFMMRRAAFALTAMCLYHDYEAPTQLIIINNLSVGFLSYLLWVRPHIKSDWDWQFVDVVNEISFLLVTYLMIIILMMDDKIDFKINTSWAILAIVSANFLFNMKRFYLDLWDKVCYLRQKLMVRFVFGNKTANEDIKVTQEEFSRMIFLKHSSNKYHAHQKALPFKKKTTIDMGNHMSMTKNPQIEYEYYTRDIDKKSGNFIDRQVKQAPLKQFYKMDIPRQNDNQVVPITDKNQEWNEVNLFLDKQVRLLKWNELVKQTTKRFKKVDVTGWKKHARELKRWDSEDQLSEIAEKSEWEEVDQSHMDRLNSHNAFVQSNDEEHNKVDKHFGTYKDDKREMVKQILMNFQSVPQITYQSEQKVKIPEKAVKILQEDSFEIDDSIEESIFDNRIESPQKIMMRNNYTMNNDKNSAFSAPSDKDLDQNQIDLITQAVLKNLQMKQQPASNLADLLRDMESRIQASMKQNISEIKQLRKGSEEVQSSRKSRHRTRNVLKTHGTPPDPHSLLSERPSKPK